MKQLKKDTLKNGDVFNISFLPRGDDAVSTTQWQTSFRKAKWITDNPNQGQKTMTKTDVVIICAFYLIFMFAIGGFN